MTILVTAANGQLGNERRIVSKNYAEKCIFTDVKVIIERRKYGLDLKYLIGWIH